MKIKPFQLERYFAKYEFSTPHLLSCSDCEPLTQDELLNMADDKTLELWAGLRLAYTESQGHHALREQVCQLHEHIRPDDVLVLAPEEGIFIAMNVLLEPGDHVVTTFPGYQSLYEIAQGLGCSVGHWTPDGQYRFNVESLFQQVTEKTRLLIINFPHNPTGAVIEERELKTIIEFAREHDLRIFSDEMYRFLEYHPDLRLPPVCDLYENSLSLFGMSKSFALPGLRIGWLTTSDKKLMQALCEFKDYTTICSSAPSEILALIGLQNRDHIISRNLEIIRKNLVVLERFFERHSKLFQWIRPLGGSVAFPKWLGDIPVDMLCRELVEKEGVMLLPSTVYGFEIPAIRFGLGRKNLPKGLVKLEHYLRGHV